MAKSPAKEAPPPPPAAGPFLVLAGDELFARNQHLAQIKEALFGNEDPGIGYIRFDQTANIATVLDECRTLGMFSPKKLIVVDPADALLKGGSEDEAPSSKRPSLSNRELLENYLESPEPSATLVLVCESWLKTTRLHKALDKIGAVRWCEPIKDYQTPAWIVKRARDAYNKSVEPQAAQRLAELIGPDLQRLDNELAKLRLYQPDAPSIALAAVDALVGFQHEQQVWDLINALAAGDAGSALRKVDELWQLDPKIEYTVTGAVFSWLGQVMRAREMLDRRTPDGVVIRELRLWPEDRARKVLDLARAWGLKGSANASRALLACDLANKTSVGEPRLNMEKFIVTVCDN